MMKKHYYQEGGIIDWFMSLFSDDAPKPAAKTPRLPNKYKINDQRKMSRTTGRPIDPKTELLSGEYDGEYIENIVKAAKRYGLDPYTAIAIDLQETGLGRHSAGSIGHSLLKRNELIPTKMGSEEEADDYDVYARSIATKMKYADKLGIKDPYVRLQAYNGLGKVFPETEQDYHGFKMKKIYGVSVPKGGIDMRKNPLYGKRVSDISDNVLKKDKVLDDFIRNTKQKGGAVVSPYGQRKYPGKHTIVPTPTGQITMKGIPYPVYGKDETGYGQMMYPNREYKFPGKMVYEVPIVKKEDSIVENITEIFDPTGVTSWDDVYRSYKKSGFSPETNAEIFGALPILGKLGKVGKMVGQIGKAVAVTNRQKNNVKAFSKTLQAVPYIGRVSDAAQAAQQLPTAPLMPNFGMENMPFAMGGRLLSRSVTCSNCSHSWKSVDGGADPLTCHKCGGLVKMQGGGLWNKNKTAWVDSVNNSNIDKNFINRMYLQNGPSMQILGEPGRSTHFMEESDNMVYPTVVQRPGSSSLEYLNKSDKNGAYNYARMTGQFIKFPTAEQAAWYANNGYKTGTGVTIGKKRRGGEMIRRADGSYSQRGLWDNVRANKGSGKKPTKKMLEQERKIKAKEMKNGGTNNPGFEALPQFVQAKILSNMAYGGMAYPFMADGGEANGEMAMGQMAAVSDKMSKLLKFIKPDENLDPWIASKLAVMDHSADAISDYLIYGPEASEQMEKMKKGGYVVSRSNDRKGKTHKVTGPDGTVKYFGDSKLGQHPRDPERKKAFYARHKKNLDKNPYFRAFARATWQDGGELENMPSAEEIIQAYADYSAMSVEAIVGELQQRSEEEQEQLLMQMYQEIVQADQQDMPEAQEEYEEDVEEVDEEESSEEETPAAEEESSSADDEDEKIDYSMIYGRGGYIDYNGRRQRSKTSTWSGNAGYAYGGYIPEFMPAASFEQGGLVIGQEMEVTPEQLEQLRAQGYQFEII
jgi:hypothetical protein